MTVDGVTHPLERPFMVDRDAEPDRVRGHVSAARRRSSTASRCGSRSAIRRSPTRRRCSTSRPTSRRSTRSSRSRARDEVIAARRAGDGRSTSRRASAGTSSRCCGRRARDSRLYLGASPRAGIALLRVAKARALADGRDYLVPDDVKAVAAPVLSHRLILGPEARSAGLGGEAIVAEALEKTPVPV